MQESCLISTFSSFFTQTLLGGFGISKLKMSLQFSNTTTKRGIIQTIERNLSFADGDISSNASTLAYFTADVNSAMDKALSLIIPASGTWQIDDSNQANYPIITTNLIANQRDYAFTTDQSGTIILDIYRVFIKTSPTGVFEEIFPVDAQSGMGTDSFTNGLEATGVPYRYDKTSNAIFLDPVPNQNVTNGLKIYINREFTSFVVGDTTKTPGFAGIFHEYLALRPSYQYAQRNSLKNERNLLDEMMKMEKAINAYYGQRDKDVRKVLSGKRILYI